MNLFQERFSFLLSENGFSRLAFAKKIGTTPATLNGYFNSDFYPEISIAINIAQFFNCSLDYLFGLTEDKTVKYSFENKNLAKNFMDNFTRILKSHKLPVSRAMKTLGFGEYSFYRWRKEVILPKTSNLVVIAEYFDVSVDYLLGHE